MGSNSNSTEQKGKSIVLVTGGAGFIGSNFIRYLLKNYGDVAVINLDKLTYAGNLANLKDVEDRYGIHAIESEDNASGNEAPQIRGQQDREDNSRYYFIKGDITDRSLVDNVFSGEYFDEDIFASEQNQGNTRNTQIDAVVNFAAESHVDRSVLDAAPFVETNIKGTQTLLDVAKKYWMKDSDGSLHGSYLQTRDAPIFVQISTDEVYGALGETGKFTEESPLEPNNPYSASKASADMLCRSYYQAYEFPVVITRSSNNYGPYQFPEKLIPLMIRNALAGEELPIYGEGKEVRDWLYVEDNCRGVARVLQEGKPGEVYNIAGGSEERNVTVVKNICNILEEKITKTETNLDLEDLIKFIDDPRGGAHDFRYALDYTKINQELGWDPEYGFRDGLERTIEWYLDNQEWVEEVVTGEYKEYYERFYGS